MKIIVKLIRVHKILFFGATFITFCAVGMTLLWNRLLADLIDGLGSASSLQFKTIISVIGVVLLFVASEGLSMLLAAYTCELFAHEMRMGYARFYLHSNVGVLSGLNVGEEQSAMQNELSEISSYLNENLFSLIKQVISFIVTVIFLLYQNTKLTMVSIIPVIPLILYCGISGKAIKKLTEQCQESRQQINGIFHTVLELFPIIQVYRAADLMESEMKQRIREWQMTSIRKERIAALLMSLSGVFSFVPLLCLFGYGGFLVINGEITLGVFYIFINLSGNVSGFLQNMPGIYAGFKGFSAAIGRIEKKVIL